MEKINIIIVDDSADNLMVLEAALEQENISVFTTTSPHNALQICTDNPIDIALIDVNMPGLNGYELLASFKKNPLTDQILVVFITGYSMNSADVVKGLELGAVDYLFKPLDLYIIIAKITSLQRLIYYQREIKSKNTELQRYQSQLLEAVEATEKSKQVKENFFANMSHEIRTPLNAIMGLTYLLGESNLNEDQSEFVKLLEYSAGSLLGIVNDILEISKIDAGMVKINKVETDIFNLIENICSSTRPMAVSKGLELISEISPDVPGVILVDALRLNQILINLINNAIKFTSTGKVQLKVSVLESEGTLSLLEFAVIDSGVGIAEELIDVIFSRFEQLENTAEDKFGGTGLGLSIVKKLAELKGGQIKVKSKPGLGSTFTFTNWYERAPGDSPGELNRNEKKLKSFEHVRILIADDNEVNRIITEKILLSWNVAVDIAENGLEAFEKVKCNDYNLIMMDVFMPLMNGIEAITKIRQELTGTKKNIPIISFSSSITGVEKDKARQAGATDFVNKPVNPSVLHATITKLLQHSQS